MASNQKTDTKQDADFMRTVKALLQTPPTPHKPPTPKPKVPALNKRKATVRQKTNGPR